MPFMMIFSCVDQLRCWVVAVVAASNAICPWRKPCIEALPLQNERNSTRDHALIMN